MKFLGVPLSLLLLCGLRASAAAAGSGFLQQQQQQLPLGVSPPADNSAGTQHNGDGDGEDDAPPYRGDLVALHRSLVEIPSISGDENAVGEFLVDYLAGRGFIVERQYLPPRNHASSSTSSSSAQQKPRFNVLAWRGAERRDPRPKVLVTSHIDVVPPYIPYSATETPPGPDTTISGRGSVDAKAAVAAQVVALESLLLQHREYAAESGSGLDRPEDVLLLFVVGEEDSGDGMRFFSGHREPLAPASSVRAVVFGEPTEGRLACGHKGIFLCDVAARGRAGHSGYPWRGQSAIETLMRGLLAVLAADLGSTPEFGNTTVNVGTITGGVAANVIAEAASAHLAGRVAIGPELDGGRIAAERMIDVLRGVDPDAFDVDCGGRNGYGVVKCNCDVEGKFFFHAYLTTGLSPSICTRTPGLSVV